MTDTAFAAADRLLAQAFDALDACVESGGDVELIALLGRCEGAVRRLDRGTVSAVAGLERRGAFAERGSMSSAAALGDLLGWERPEARRRVVAAEQVTPRVGLGGAVLPARLPVTAEVFAAGRAGLRHVDAIARVLGSASAARLSPAQWAGVEEQLAEKAQVHTPSELQAWGNQLVEILDQDGAEPGDRPPVQVNELHVTRLPGGGGRLKGRFDDAVMFDAIATVVDAKARPLTADDDRSVGERQADALAEVCGYVLDHGDVPECGGHRPHVTVLIRLDDLQNRARAACLDFGGTATPEALRMLVCDAAAVPIVLDGTGQPLDLGRARRTIPDGLRRAVARHGHGHGMGRPAWRLRCGRALVLAWGRGALDRHGVSSPTSPTTAPA